MRALAWRYLDPNGRAIRLPAELSKNAKPRLLPLTGELANIIQRAKARRRLDCVFIFHHNEKPLGDFRKRWKRSCGVGTVCQGRSRPQEVRRINPESAVGAEGCIVRGEKFSRSSGLG
jgi:integrase